jgi:prophage antirepressor-like protein
LLDHVDQEDKVDGVTIRDSIGREQKAVFINESGLYHYECEALLVINFQQSTIQH